MGYCLGGFFQLHLKKNGQTNMGSTSILPIFIYYVYLHYVKFLFLKIEMWYYWYKNHLIKFPKPKRFLQLWESCISRCSRLTPYQEEEGRVGGRRKEEEKEEEEEEEKEKDDNDHESYFLE